jgi:ABC-type nickel/cobalt efflux system permease component RcnA
LSGVAVAFIGARAFSRQISANRPYAHAHAHGHAHAHPHEHEHVHHPLGEQDHAHDDGHSHAIPGNRPLRFGPTVVAAMSGGIAPCPAALVVLFAAIAQNALAYGVVAIVFFSFGLAATLTGLGIAVVRGASWLGARPKLGRLVRYGPLVSAAIIAVVGSVMVGQGMVQQGLPVSAPIVTALTALAIVGYAFAHPLGRAREAQAA